jgi:two-component system copper resistance phosphate regulon response regulator CusR
MATNGNKTILLVTGDADQAEALRRPLVERGHGVVIAKNGAEGLLAAHAEHPALIVADAELPVMDGYRMLEVLRDDPATRLLTIILLTSGETETELARGWLCGADFCLPRQSALSDLILMVERTLRLEDPAVSFAS